MISIEFCYVLRLEDEINEVMGERSGVTFDDISKLKYMDAVWKEIQRYLKE